MIEIVLPSGKFATIREIKARDLIEAQRLEREGTNIMVAMIFLAVRIDGTPVGREEVLDMDVRDFVAIQSKLGELISGPVPSRPS